MTGATAAAIAGIAFCAEYIDSTLGMGYGTCLTPLLMLFGFEPLQVVPAVLVSEFVTGLLAGFTHHSVGNVDFRPKTTNVSVIYRKLRELGIVKSFNKGFPLHLRITMLIALCSIIGTVAAVFLAVNLSKFHLKLYIGCLITVIGLFTLATTGRSFRFSWKKITLLGLVASFNKGLSGGGYGPVVTGGQLLSGLEGKNAVAITSLAEGLTCLVGIICYLATGKSIDWTLAPWLLAGAILSVPLSACTVRKMKTEKLRLMIGVFTLGLGCLTLYKVFF